MRSQPTSLQVGGRLDKEKGYRHREEVLWPNKRVLVCRHTRWLPVAAPGRRSSGCCEGASAAAGAPEE